MNLEFLWAINKSSGPSSSILSLHFLFGALTQLPTFHLSNLILALSPPCFLGQELQLTLMLLLLSGTFFSRHQHGLHSHFLSSPCSTIIIIKEAFPYSPLKWQPPHSLPLACLYSSPWHLSHSDVLLVSICWFIYWFICFLSLECRLQAGGGFVCFIHCYVPSV